MNLDWETSNHKTRGWQSRYIVEFHDMAVPDFTPSTVPLPNKTGVSGHLITLSCVDERGIPAPGICTSDANALFQQMKVCLTPHPATCGNIVVFSIAFASTSVH